jgi:cysteine desulfurase
MIYLDHNATTQPLPEVIEEIARCQREAWANPGSRHAAGRKARRVLDDSRETIARLIGAAPEELIFTSGGTESINLALRGLVGTRPGVILHGAGEHPATIETCRWLALVHGHRLREIPVDAQGELRSPHECDIPWDDVRLVTILWGHNETGVVQPVEAWSQTCRERNIPLHLDAVQMVGKLPARIIDFHASGATAMSFASHKFHGPRGIGGLAISNAARLTPQLTGGHQERDRRAGTELAPLAAGMALALQAFTQVEEQATGHMLALRDLLEQRLLESCGPAHLFGALAPRRLPNTTQIAFEGVSAEALLVNLDLAGVACSAGSTCASGSMEPSPILLAMGVSPDLAKSSIRLSLGRFTTIEETLQAAEIIAKTVTRLRKS